MLIATVACEWSNCESPVSTTSHWEYAWAEYNKYSSGGGKSVSSHDNLV